MTDRLLEELARDEHDVVVVNCNPDMVGHTGIMEATVSGGICDGSGQARSGAGEKGRFADADHGNCEQMVDPETGEPHTAHTADLVPFILVAEKYRQVSLSPGALRDIAPTILDLLKIEQPAEMTGRSLICSGGRRACRLQK